MSVHSGPAVIDFSLYGLDKEEDDLSDEELTPLAEQLLKSLSDTGVAYLLNHGIQKQDITVAKDTVRPFFHLPLETKMKYTFKDVKTLFQINGYSPPGLERADATTGKENPRVDIMDALHIRPLHQTKWPDEDVIGIRSASTRIINLCEMLSRRILKLLGIGLNLQDSQAMMKLHRFAEEQDPSSLKFGHYLPLPQGEASDRQRLGEHTDISVFTLIFQDDTGGLECQTPSGTWMPLPPMQDSVVIMSGDVLEILSAGEIMPLLHRVAFPQDPEKRALSRFSMLYFVLPSMDAAVTCLDGSDKYKPTTLPDMIERKLSGFFADGNKKQSS